MKSTEDEVCLRSDLDACATKDNDDDDSGMQCGVGSWRPRCLQRFATLNSFTATISLLTVFSSVNYTYYTAVITQIERCFGLSSSATGFIKNVDDIGFVMTVVISSYMFRSTNKPRLFAVLTVFSSLAILLFSLPHYLYSTGPVTTFHDINLTSSQSSKFPYCRDLEGKNKITCEERTETGGSVNRGAMIIFIISQLLQGMMQSPRWTLSVAHMDDNSREKSPTHIGILFGSRAISPVLGFLIGAWTTSLYVDLSDPGLDQRDPRWIGAWWLGFIICAALTLIWAFPILLFPPRFSRTPPVVRPITREGPKNLLNRIKGLLKSSKKVLSNTVFMFTVIGSCFNMGLHLGYAVFIAKYIQSHYGLTASKASIYTGVVTAVSWSIGPIVVGRIISKLRMTTASILRFVVFIHLVAIAGFVGIMFLSCPSAEWAGTMNINEQIIDQPCNGNCSCDVTSFIPVCGSDGKNYFSPCYAGCREVLQHSNSSNTMFTDCSCIEGGTATLGMCSTECPLFYLYIVLLSILQLATGMVIVPVMTIIMRCVEEENKALSLAFAAFITHLAAFPVPVGFGALLDSTCIVSQVSCDDTKGACLLYNNEMLRHRYHTLPLGLCCCAVLSYVIAWIRSRQIRRHLSPAELYPPLECRVINEQTNS